MANNELSSIQLLAVESLGNPDDTRNMTQIAHDLKIAPETLSRWKRNPVFMKAVNDKLNECMTYPRSDVWKSMVKHAKDKSHQDRKLYLTAVGDIESKSNVSGVIDLNIQWGKDELKVDNDENDDES